MSRTIFSRATYNSQRSFGRAGRVELLSQDVANELNTYKNFGVFPTFNEAYVNEWDPNDPSKSVIGTQDNSTPGTPGVRSMFNKYSSVLTGADNNTGWRSQAMKDAINDLVVKSSGWRKGNNVPILDHPENRRAQRAATGCTVRELVQASQKGYFGRAPYSYADFMYCKYLGAVPNNYLITLRRFPVPTNDSIMPSGHMKQRGTKAGKTDISHPIGTMVTWLGVSGNDMKNILKYSVSMPFEEKTAKWEDVQQEGGSSGILNQIDALADPATRKAYMKGYTGGKVQPLDDFMSGFFNAGKGAYSSEPRYDQNKVYGPIDRVKKNYARSEAGLDQEMSFDLVFEYELRSYNGINPRQAMLDLLANILSTCYTTGGFWPGGYRGTGARQNSIFSKMSVFKCHGSFTDMVDAFTNDISNAADSAKKSLGIGEGASVMDVAKKILSMLNDVGGILMGGLLNKLGRPAKFHANSLISDQPVGLWHITVGNPHHPIISIGNMILKKTTIEHSGPLGMDDFPTQLKVTCSFDRGKPRDQVGIEQMYMNGNDRIFYSMEGKVADMYKLSDEYRKNPSVTSSSVSVDNSNSDTEVKADQTSTGTPTEITTESINGEEKTTVKNVSEMNYGNIFMHYLGDWDSEAMLYASQEADHGAFKCKPIEKSESNTEQNENSEETA